MTSEELIAWRAKVAKHRSLLPRLDAGDELHREAAAEIRRVQKLHNEDMREASRDAQSAYREGRQDEAESGGAWR